MNQRTISRTIDQVVAQSKGKCAAKIEEDCCCFSEEGGKGHQSNKEEGHRSIGSCQETFDEAQEDQEIDIGNAKNTQRLFSEPTNETIDLAKGARRFVQASHTEVLDGQLHVGRGRDCR
ncbi:hypothetical protein ACDT12_12910 [Staphylococcus aureus]